MLNPAVNAGMAPKEVPTAKKSCREISKRLLNISFAVDYDEIKAMQVEHHTCAIPEHHGNFQGFFLILKSTESQRKSDCKR